MVGIIIIENGSGVKALELTINSIQSKTPQVQLCVVADNSFATTHAVSKIRRGSDSWHDALCAAADKCKSDRLLIIDASLSIAPELVEQLIAEVTAASDQSICYLPYHNNTELVDLPNMSTDGLVQLVAYQECWPLLTVSIPTSFLKEYGSKAAESCGEYLGGIVIQATNATVNIQQFSCISNIQVPTLEGKSLLSESERARLMRIIVSNCNIEELFPNYAWNEWDQESAAAAYHSLAAHFIRLGDTNSALECLGLSDHLEDSPRSLALKGLIAMKQGEQLTAVANMVSSLQQYEIRKKQSDQHYLSFIPNDMAEVNRRLNLGLKALNQRDNETAASHFAEAVFDFDGFYREFGVAS